MFVTVVVIRLEFLVMVAAGPLVFVQVVSSIGCPGFRSFAVPVRVIEFLGRKIMVSAAGEVFPDTVGWAIVDTAKRVVKIVKRVFIGFACFVLTHIIPFACQIYLFENH
jgi:hypothetical protein